MTLYFDALCEAMSLCAEHPRSIFLGQSVACDGTAISKTLKHIPKRKLLEMPVAEDMQLGMSTGISLAGGLPISIFPRWNFLLLATNQLVNHLDAIPRYSKYKPKVIIRTAIPTKNPLDPGPQHDGDLTYAFIRMLHTVTVCRLDHAESIVPIYKSALERDGSTLIVERTELY